MPPRRKEPYRILLPLANPRTARDLVRIGSGVSNSRPKQITALGIVEVPEGVSLSEGATSARTARRLLQRVLDFGDEEGVEIRTIVRISRRAPDGIIEAVTEEEADLIIFGWGGVQRPEAGGKGVPGTHAAGRAGEAAQALVIVVPSKVINFDHEARTINQYWVLLRAIFSRSDH
jgi:hypothetical protein